MRSAYYGRDAKEKESHYWNSYIIDPQTGEVKKKVKAISEWAEKEKWQEPGPILKSEDGLAYITDAAKKELVVVDIYSGEVTARHSLDVAPVEMAIF